MKVSDILIIGGGVIGSAIARELSKFQLHTALIEKEAELAFGVSKSNSGIIHAGTQNPRFSLKGKLCVQGNKLIRKTAKQLGVHFEQVGELIIAFSESDKLELIKIKNEAKALGVKRQRIVGEKWIRKHEPNLSRKIKAALFVPSAGIISPYRLTYGFAENAKANGVRIFTQCQAINIRPFQKGNYRFQVMTNKGMFCCNWIINAAGLFADEIAGMVNINDINVIPRKGEEYLLDSKQERVVNHIIFPLPTKISKGILIIKTSDGNPMIGPTAKNIDDKDDLTTSESGLEEILEHVKKIVPVITQQDIIAYFAGLRPAAGKDFIIRYEKTVPGFINVAGIQSPGLTASPAIACYVRDILNSNGCILKRKKKFIRTRKKTTHLFAIPLNKTKKLIQLDPGYGDIVCRCEMVSAKEIRDSISRGARTMDGIKFRTRAQAGRCHGGFCTTRIMKILAEELDLPITAVTKRGKGSEIVLEKKHGNI